MIMRFDRQLTHQKIYANGRELASIMGRDRDINAAQASIDDARARYFEGDGLEFLQDRRFDLVMCNPLGIRDGYQHWHTIQMLEFR